MIEIRAADPIRDLQAVRSLWLDYLGWGNDQMEAAHGFRLPVDETVARDLAGIAKFMPPDGCIFLAFVDNEVVGIACMQRIGRETAEVKRMYVRPSHRRGGLGRAMIERLIEAAAAAGYKTTRLDSPDFMAAAHALYRSCGFRDIAPYPESEIPDEYKRHWVFMERTLPQEHAMHKGSCLCGAVSFEVAGALPAPDACHCSQCRKQSGHFFASTDVARTALTIHGGDNLTWFQSSEKVRRGFCSRCGSSLFWDPIRRDWIGVAMGAFDQPTGTRLGKHIFVAEKGDYYDIADGLPQNQR